jgi:hypothetical protein
VKSARVGDRVIVRDYPREGPATIRRLYDRPWQRGGDIVIEGGVELDRFIAGFESWNVDDLEPAFDPQPGEKWRRKPAGYDCEVLKVKDGKARMKDAHLGNTYWVSFLTLWLKWECLFRRVAP